jgi:hypothetical protein
MQRTYFNYAGDVVALTSKKLSPKLGFVKRLLA